MPDRGQQAHEPTPRMTDEMCRHGVHLPQEAYEIVDVRKHGVVCPLSNRLVRPGVAPAVQDRPVRGANRLKLAMLGS
jgi:hypothetical protein